MTEMRDPTANWSETRSWDVAEYGDGKFESGIVTNKQAWHGMAAVHLEAEAGKLYADEAIVKGGLDWEVGLVPVEYKDAVVEGKFFTVRIGDDKVLGVVGKSYRPVQNREGFRLLNDLVDSDDVEIETAISLRGGKTVAIVARRPENILIAGEDVVPYLIFTNSHDGTGSVTMLTSPVRVVCQNTLNVAVRGAKSVYRVRHTSSATSRINEAREALQLSFSYSDSLAVMGEQLVSTKITDREFERFLKGLVPAPKPDGKNVRTVNNRERTRDGIREVYRKEDNLNDIRGTAWGALNAVAEYEDHGKKYRTDDRRFQAIVEEAGQGLKQDALELLLARS